MIRNRSVPVDTVLPHLYYERVDEAINWLRKVFGFFEYFRYGDPVQGAQMYLGDAWIMVGGTRPDRSSPNQVGAGTQSLTVFVGNVDRHFELASAAGARIVEDLHETPYGERQYGAKDLEGHHWLFSMHVRDVSPEEWGATSSRIESNAS